MQARLITSCMTWLEGWPPATEAGVSNHVWTLDEIVGLID
jgi:hypothetical protein